MVTLKANGIEDRAIIALDAGVEVSQTTLRSSVKLMGVGLHTGRDTSVTIHPASENSGIVFTDGKKQVRALAENVIDTSRGTTIGLNGTRVRTVEHLMSALRGMGVDNALIEVDGSEMPALDGSAGPYVEAIDSVGLEKSDAKRQRVVIDHPVCAQQGDSFILAVPSDELRFTYVMRYDHPMIGVQMSSYVLNEDDYGAEIAVARTFVLYEEVAGLLDMELARGGSLDNVIVVWQDKVSSALRYPDEFVRHKVLDMVGDLALVGGLLQADILAVKSGHTLNVELANRIRRAAQDSGDAGLIEDIGQSSWRQCG